MTKHRYVVSGLDSQGNKFLSECIDDDIISAIWQYKDVRFSVHSIKREEQVKATAEKKIVAMLELGE